MSSTFRWARVNSASEEKGGDMNDGNKDFWYRGTRFTSQEAMDLYAASRADKPSGASMAPWKQALIACLIVTFVFVILAKVINEKHDLTPASGTPGPTENTIPNVSFDTKETLALMINVHGELCAQVNNVERVDVNEYSVTCTRYRDGTGSASYIVNARTGVVK